MSTLVFSLAIKIVIGGALIFWARPISERYNAWTTKLRERNPHINPPPTPEWRARNTQIMTWIFRAAGALLALMALVQLIPIVWRV